MTEAEVFFKNLAEIKRPVTEFDERTFNILVKRIVVSKDGIEAVWDDGMQRSSHRYQKSPKQCSAPPNPKAIKHSAPSSHESRKHLENKIAVSQIRTSLYAAKAHTLRPEVHLSLPEFHTSASSLRYGS